MTLATDIRRAVNQRVWYKYRVCLDCFRENPELKKQCGHEYTVLGRNFSNSI